MIILIKEKQFKKLFDTHYVILTEKITSSMSIWYFEFWSTRLSASIFWACLYKNKTLHK